MTSPARRHFEKNIAALKTEQGSDQDRAPANANQYELMLVKLAEDKRRLSTMQSMEKRAELKLQLLPEYTAWVQGVIEGDQGVQDDVLMTVMVWNIDAGQLAEALPIAAYAIKHGLKMPDQYKRTTPVVIAEEIADRYLKAHAAKEPINIDIIQQAIDITIDQDMPDEVKAKLYKALGYALAADESLVPENFPDHATRLGFALQSFNRALALHDKVGVKKDIEAVERELKNLAPTQ
jgi:hypothetical protein